MIVFLIIGSYKGLFDHSGAQDVGKVFRAIGLSSLLLFVLIVINHTWQVSPQFNIPLSIIVIYSLLSIVGMTVSHAVIKAFYNALVNKTSNK
jgi:FlaA1/EpsC-like NDP-sugar epimerase